MMGKVCRVFPGHTFPICLKMTPRQLYGIYVESIRQEARWKLSYLDILSISRLVGEDGKDALDRLSITAFPPDEESDGIFGDESFDDLKKIFAGFG
jgi:hypothetical protein